MTVESQNSRQRCAAPLPLRWLIATALIGCLGSLALSVRSHADPPPAAPQAAVAPQVGIGGVYRPGHWTAVRLAAATGLAEQVGQERQPDRPPPTDVGSGDRDGLFQAIVQIETWDGDGVRTIYTQPNSGVSRWAYASPGVAAAPLRLTTEGGQLVRSRWGDGAIEPQTPWVVVIGDPLAITTVGRNELLGRESSVAVSVAQSSTQLPDHAIGWDGVDLLVINRQGRGLIAELSERQIAAITDWLIGGGRILLSPGQAVDELLDVAPWLARLASIGPEVGTVQIDAAGLETFTSSQTRLPVLRGMALDASSGRPLISGRNLQRQPIALAIERTVGLGRLTITSFPLDDPELAGWAQRLTLINRLLPGVLESDSDRRRDSRPATVAPYNDLAGQIRSGLDRFQLNRQIPFSVISAVLLTLVALVGPLDYWLINRVLGKPLLGWVSFPLSVLAVGGILVLLARPGDAITAESPLRENRIEIIDIAGSGDQAVARLTSIGHLYSGAASLADYSPTLTAAWSDLAAKTAASPTASSVLTRPYGYASSTFGGILIAGEDPHLPAYQVNVIDGGAAAPLTSRLNAIPIAPAGAKGFVSSLSFPIQMAAHEGLAQRRGNELLTGQLTNPLPMDLLDGVLVYGNWAYLLPTRLGAGQTIASIESLRQKNFRWHLLRRVVTDNSMSSDLWDPEMTDDLPRLAEILMFEQAVGGRDYTGLSNRPWKSLDLSYLLSDKQAILYGRLEAPILDTGVTAQQPVASAVRIVLPVAAPAPR